MSKLRERLNKVVGCHAGTSSLRNLVYYFRKAWLMGRGYLIFSFLRVFFEALLSLVDIAGLGAVVSALSRGAEFTDVVRVIISYVLVNLGIVLAGQGLRLGENLAMRRASNVLQYQYMRDCLDIDYHFVSDGRFLNLKKKSMGGYPVFSIHVFGELFGAVVRLAGVMAVFALVSPLFILILLALSAGIIALTIYSQRCDWRFGLENAEDERALGQLYDIMTKYRYAKEIRINGAAGFISGKYRAAFDLHMARFRALLRRKLGVGWRMLKLIRIRRFCGLRMCLSGIRRRRIMF